VSTIDTVPAVEAYVIYGACVGGPDEKDEFWDLRGDYARSEVAIDYNAPVLTLVAHQILVGNTDPYYTALQPGTFTATSGSPCTDDYPCDDGGGGLSTGAKIAIGVIVPVVVIGLILGAWWWYRRKHGRMSSWR
jgi:endoglucanase